MMMVVMVMTARSGRQLHAGVIVFFRHGFFSGSAWDDISTLLK
jgi:hypothetical protein